MSRHRIAVPEGHGEVASQPPLDSWAELARANSAAARSWDFPVAGRPITEVRQDCRRETRQRAHEYTSGLGIPSTAPTDDDAPLIVTGHQPELLHPGVWAKYFMVQRVCEEVAGDGIDLVVDSDAFESVAMTVPCDGDRIGRCVIELAAGDGVTCYGRTPVPDARGLSAFLEAGESAVASLGVPELAAHMTRFGEALRAAASTSGDIGALVTGARRRYEGALTGYRDVSVLALTESDAYRAFAADIVCGAPRFAVYHNAELAAFRAKRSLRSVAQPFPDLDEGADGTELPFWYLDESSRRIRPFVRQAGGEIVLRAGDTNVSLPSDPAGCVEALSRLRIVLAPRALTLTLFARTFLADLFVHGVGGSRYDEVTEGVAHRYWGVELPPFAAVTLTMHLPLGARVVHAEEVTELDRTLKRLTHNPDEFLGEMEFDDPKQAAIARDLAGEKRELVEAIGREGADRKTLGMRIAEVNARLAEMVAPLVAEIEAERAHLVGQLEAAEVLTDRRYPLCLWDPEEVAAALR